MDNSESENIWRLYTESKIIKESFNPDEITDDVIDDIWTYYRDRTPIDEISEEFDISEEGIRYAIRIAKRKYADDENQTDNSISIDPKKRSDQVDGSDRSQWKTRGHWGRAEVTDVAPQKKRTDYGLSKRFGGYKKRTPKD